MRQRRPVLLVFLPFVAGYFISYFFRTINALISVQLTSELGLGAADLGLLTSAYFLTFSLVQLPLGLLLDRYGPRRVQGTMLLVAAAGAALFAAGHSFTALFLGRALIGLGVAAALMAGLKAIILWFPRERLPLVNGWFVMLGGLGAVTATAPAELVLTWMGWRGLFAVLAVVTAGVAVLIVLVVPEPAGPREPKDAGALSLKAIYADTRFWRVAPLSAACIGTAWALQGLWAAPWLTDVEKIEPSQIVDRLFTMAVALCAGAILLGAGADRLRRLGVPPQVLLGWAAVVFIVAQVGLITGWPVPSSLLWAVVASIGGATVLSYAILAEYFSKGIAGQANAALNVLHIGGACILQYAIGFVIELWPSQGGHFPPIAYKTAFLLNIILQIAALVWFLRPEGRPSTADRRHPITHLVWTSGGVGGVAVKAGGRFTIHVLMIALVGFAPLYFVQPHLTLQTSSPAPLELNTAMSAPEIALSLAQPDVAAPSLAQPSAEAVARLQIPLPPIAEPEMMVLSGGTFTMGSNDDISEKPIHKVTVKPFSISKFPITVREWSDCVAAKGCASVQTGDDDAPVADLNWNDTQQFIAWLTEATHKPFRLPSEAEWEFAARGGTATKYWWGDRLQMGMANCKGCGEPYDPKQPLDASGVKPNPFGLYHMGGGVAQWVADCWHLNYRGAPVDGSPWVDEGNCISHVIRSGSWKNDPSYVRPASRGRYDGSARYLTLGFRVAKSP